MYKSASVSEPFLILYNLIWPVHKLWGFNLVRILDTEPENGEEAVPRGNQPPG